MKTINISDARNRLPSVLDEVIETHEVIVVTRYGTPMVSITPIQARATEQDRYPLRGRCITMADDFDEPLPELWNALSVAERRGEYTVGKGSSACDLKCTASERTFAGKRERRKKKG